MIYAPWRFPVVWLHNRARCVSDIAAIVLYWNDQITLLEYAKLIAARVHENAQPGEGDEEE